MKAIYVFVCAATILLIAKSTGLFATTKNCTVVACCCHAAMNTTKSKKAAAEISIIETNPFDILIPGNHY